MNTYRCTGLPSRAVGNDQGLLTLWLGVLPSFTTLQKGLAALCWRFICPHHNILLRTDFVPGTVLGDWVMSTKADSY